MDYKPFGEYKSLDNIPTANLFLDIVPTSLGTSETGIKPKAMCGCKETFATINNTSNQVTPNTIITNENNGYDVLNISPQLHKVAFDELGPIGEGENEDEVETTSDSEDENEDVKPQQYQFDTLTNIYIGSLSVIGLFALYRLIQKTR